MQSSPPAVGRTYMLNLSNQFLPVGDPRFLGYEASQSQFYDGLTCTEDMSLA